MNKLFIKDVHRNGFLLHSISLSCEEAQWDVNLNKTIPQILFLICIAAFIISICT